MSIINVICDNLENNPECPHGPTLKFVRQQQNKQQLFYACSAYRDRKDCSFYLLVEDKITEGKKLAWALEKKRVLPNVNIQECVKRFKRTKSLSAKERGYCYTCNILLSHTEFICHKGHNIQVGISNYLLTHPSQLFKPKDNSKQEAQYFFSAKTTELIVNNLKSLNVNRVLCMGTPRIHEKIQEMGGVMESLLLDFDHRYYNFYNTDKFCWFNMFNCHFLEQSAAEEMKRFISKGKFALVTDPPFGGRVEPIAYTIHKISKMCSASISDILVFWIFPYFMEPQVLSACPNFSMLDYKVAYDNHQEFQNNNKGRKHGSPIRIFSNVEPSLFPLPFDEGYRLCKICRKWIAAENKHCKKCGTCTSKDGQTYIHCDECKKCVKPSWQHCTACQRCTLPDHTCLRNKVNETRSEEEEPISKMPRLHQNKKQKQKFKIKSSKNKFVSHQNNKMI